MDLDAMINHFKADAGRILLCSGVTSRSNLKDLQVDVRVLEQSEMLSRLPKPYSNCLRDLFRK